jgi:hypothetical protein
MLCIAFISASIRSLVATPEAKSVVLTAVAASIVGGICLTGNSPFALSCWSRGDSAAWHVDGGVSGFKASVYVVSACPLTPCAQLVLQLDGSDTQVTGTSPTSADWNDYIGWSLAQTLTVPAGTHTLTMKYATDATADALLSLQNLTLTAVSYQPRGHTCPIDLHCCSQTGTCGVSTEYCGSGCQSTFSWGSQCSTDPVASCSWLGPPPVNGHTGTCDIWPAGYKCSIGCKQQQTTY